MLFYAPASCFGTLDRFKPIQILKLVYECGLKEPWVFYRTLNNYLAYSLDPHAYDLNPDVPFVDPDTKNAHIVIFLPSMLGGSYNFLDWIKVYHNAGIKNIYAVESIQCDLYPVPLEPLLEAIHKISKQCFEQEAQNVYFSLQGHSFGALVSSKMIWRGKVADGRIHLNMLVSIGGRLRYIPNDFSWFCEDVRPDIEETYQAFLADPLKAQLTTIWGERDQLVPEFSAHISADPKNQLSVPGFGHLGIIYSTEVISKGLENTLNWYN